MGLHDDLMSDSVGVHMSTFGQDVTYSDPAGSPVTIENVIVGHEYNERRYFQEGYEYVKTRTFEIDVDENSETFCGVATIVPNGYIEVGNQKYGIERIGERTVNGTVTAFCVMRNPGRRTREGMRGRN